MAPKNALTIRLAEPVVFLRGSAESTVTGRRATRPVQPAMLRGLLILQIDKPTKISSIEITLEGKSLVSWPEGVGARRLDVTEDHEIFCVTSTFFKAGKDSVMSARRTASIGPGLVCDHEDIEDDSTSNEETHRPHRRRDSASFPWLHASRRRMSIDQSNIYSTTRPRTSLDDVPTPPYSPPSTRPTSFIRRDSNSNHPPLASGSAPQLHSQNSSVSFVNTPGSASIRSGISNQDFYDQQLTTGSPLRPQLSHDSGDSALTDAGVSRHDEITAESSVAAADARSQSRGRARMVAISTSNAASANSSRAPSLSTAPHSPMTPLRPMFPSTNSSASNSNSVLAAHPHMAAAADSEGRTPSNSPHRERGRRHNRFSLMSVSNALLDAVKERVRSTSRQKEFNHSPAASRDHSPEMNGARSRGPSRFRDESPGTERGRQTSRTETGTGKEKQKEKFMLGRIGDVLGLDKEEREGDHDNWKEFRKGIYTYPISIAIPGNAPPSLQCEFGSINYRLKAVVHRPGAFTHRMTASRDVTLIASPGEDDVEESDNIVVQREWDSQMHYQIIISGRTFPIGSSIPVHLTFMPIAKIKIFRISASIEEKVEYLTQGKRVTRSEPIHKYELLAVRHFTKEPLQILPLTTDYSESPLKGLIEADDDSEAASSLMGPGPWDVVANLDLPKSCQRMHFTNKHKRSNINISHTLKLIFRVERGDDEYLDTRTGTRKHFDIVVQTPMHILSCHCNYEWTSLPRYSTLGFGQLSKVQGCPCVQRELESRTHAPGRTDHGDVSIPGLPIPHQTPLTVSQTTPMMHAFHPLELHSDLPVVGERRHEEEAHENGFHGGLPAAALPANAQSDVESLYQRNAQFARLVAGEEGPMGDAPPRYESVAGQNNENALGAQTTADVIELH